MSEIKKNLEPHNENGVIHTHVVTFDSISGRGVSTVGGEIPHRHVVKNFKVETNQGHGHKILDFVAPQDRKEAIIFTLDKKTYRVK